MSIDGAYPVSAKLSNITPEGLHRLFMDGIAVAIENLWAHFEESGFEREQPLIVISTPDGAKHDLLPEAMQALRQGTIRDVMKDVLELISKDGGSFLLDAGVFRSSSEELAVTVDANKGTTSFRLESGTSLMDASVLFSLLRDGQATGEVDGGGWNEEDIRVILDPEAVCVECLDDGALYTCTSCGKKHVTLCRECAVEHDMVSEGDDGHLRYTCNKCFRRGGGG